MAKAFNDEEKLEIKQKMMDIALMLFHESGTKGLSIKELTTRMLSFSMLCSIGQPRSYPPLKKTLVSP